MKPDKIYLSLVFIAVTTTVLWIASCTHKPDISGIPPVCFDTEVLPIFLNNCALANCHDGKGGGGEEEAMPLTNYSQIFAYVTPGNPEASQIYKAITATAGENKMPPAQPLTQNNRTIIRVWIEQGAKETLCGPQAFAAFSSETESTREH